MAQVEFWVDGDGVTNTWTLPSLPYGLVQAYFNGVLLDPNSYTVAGQQVMTSFVPEGGSEPDQVGFLYFTSPSPAPPAPPGAGPSSLIQVSEVINDPDLAQPFLILRSVGQWNLGTWMSSTTEYQGYGVITEPTVNELEMVPEGDKVKGVMVFWSVAPLYVTHATEGAGGSSDLLLWRDLTFRVLSVKRYSDWGYYRAIGVRLKAD